MSRQRWMTRATVSLILAAVAGVWLDASGTLSSFTVATVTNPTGSARTGALSISNSQGSGCSATPASPSVVTSCSTSVYPTSATSAASSGTDIISNTGTVPAAATVAKYRIASCGPVALANRGNATPAANAAGALLPRRGTTFAPTTGPTNFTGSGTSTPGSVVLDGSTGYASSVTATTEPTGAALLGNATYGMGVWFRSAPSSAVQPLFGFGSNALDSTATNDRILYLDAAGRIGFVASAAGTSTTTGTATGVSTYTNNLWHFAWVAISTSNVAGIGLSYTVTVSVDGATVNTTASGLLGALTSYSGYWHLGWSPLSGASRRFTGSLSDFIVDDGGAAPTNPTPPLSYAALTGTDQWPLNDSGGSFDGTTTAGTYTGSVPTGNEPCTYVGISWTITNPVQTVTPTSSTLRSMVTAGYQNGTGPDLPVANTQTSTITLTSSAPSGSYAVGLILYAPVQTTYTAGAWSVSFTWNSPAAGSTSGSTVVIS